MAATDAAGKETADAHEAASAGQPTERNSKGLMPRGVIRVKNQYQARASWKPAGATMIRLGAVMDNIDSR